MTIFDATASLFEPHCPWFRQHRPWYRRPAATPSPVPAEPNATSQPSTLRAVYATEHITAEPPILATPSKATPSKATAEPSIADEITSYGDELPMLKTAPPINTTALPANTTALPANGERHRPVPSATPTATGLVLPASGMVSPSSVIGPSVAAGRYGKMPRRRLLVETEEDGGAGHRQLDRTSARALDIHEHRLRFDSDS